MKNFKKVCFFTLMFSALFALKSCEQQELLNSAGTTESNLVHSNDLNSINIQVEDETLVFESAQDYYSAIEIANGMDRGQLDAWEESIGFTSTRNWYNQAIDDMELDIKRANLKTKYSNKVYFDEEEDIDPLYGLYHIGTFLNQGGIVKIKNSIIKYTRDRLISIPDGDVSKLEKAMTMKKDNPAQGIYVHDLFVSYLAKTCNKSYSTSTVERTAGGKRYRLKGLYHLMDNSFVGNINNLPAYFIRYSLRIQVKHQKKKVLWKCNRTNILWAKEYEITHNMGGFGVPNPLTGTPSSTYYECDVNYTTPLMFLGPVNPTTYYSRSVTPQRIRQGAYVSSPASIYQNQDCH